MIEVRDQFRKISNFLAAKAEVAGGTGHSATTGSLRELVVQQFLVPHLPRHFEIRSGVIIDSTGARSAQQDCIIVDSRLPIIDVGSPTAGLVLAESVAATVEVKSRLDKTNLHSTLVSVARTKTLVRRGELVYSKGPAMIVSPRPVPILSYVFAFDGTDPKLLTQFIADFAYGQIDGETHDVSLIVDAVCILNRAVLQTSPRMPTVDGHNVTLPALKEPKLTMQHYRKDALFVFYRRLSSDLTYLRLKNVDLDAYFSESEVE